MRPAHFTFIFIGGLVGATLVSGCKEEATWKARSYTERTLAGTNGETPIPSELWERVITPDKPVEPQIPGHGEKDAHGEKNAHDAHGEKAEHAEKAGHEAPAHAAAGEGHGEAAGGHGEGEASIGSSIIGKTGVETDLKPLAVYLIEETRGVLGGRNQKLIFGPGGGEIDLRDFVLEKRGAFRIVFEFAPDADPTVIKRVWYLSNAQRRKFGPDWVGAGCDVYMDISTYVKNETAKDGMLIAVGGDRHVSALAGTFIFSLKRGGRVEVARLTFTDSSKRKDVQCPPRNAAAPAAAPAHEEHG